MGLGLGSDQARSLIFQYLYPKNWRFQDLYRPFYPLKVQYSAKLWLIFDRLFHIYNMLAWPNPKPKVEALK